MKVRKTLSEETSHARRGIFTSLAITRWMNRRRFEEAKKVGRVNDLVDWLHTITENFLGELEDLLVTIELEVSFLTEDNEGDASLEVQIKESLEIIFSKTSEASRDFEEFDLIRSKNYDFHSSDVLNEDEMDAYESMVKCMNFIKDCLLVQRSILKSYFPQREESQMEDIEKSLGEMGKMFPKETHEKGGLDKPIDLDENFFGGKN